MTESPPRFATPRSARKTYGGEVAKLARLLGFEPMPWQRLLWDVALEHENGKLVYGEVGCGLGRQNGKSTAELALMLHRCLRWPNQNVKYTAQTGLDARAKMFDDWLPLLEHSPLAEVMRFRRQSGHEAILFENGSKLGLVASTERSGHGSTVDMAVLDEAWAHSDHRLEQSLRPAMITRPNTQLYVISTAGTERRSPFLFEKVQTGRAAVEAGLTSNLAYLEWSASDDADPGDPATWWAAIPALGHTIDEDAIRTDYQGMARHEFQRAFLNVWTASMGESIVDLEHWSSLAEPDGPRPEWVVLGVDVAPKGASAAIVAVGKVNDDLHAAVLETGPGADWILAALERLKGELDGPHVMVDSKAVAALLPELRSALGSKLIELSTAEVPPACAFWLRLVKEGHLHHRGELELLTAIDGAATRTLGDGFAWSRRGSGTDITPLVALTFASSFWLGSWGQPQIAVEAA
jgi:phage terminase large subunit-like protein